MVKKMIQKINKIGSVSGELSLPGDKSISHRAVLISAMASGESLIENISKAEDVASSVRAIEFLGCRVERDIRGLRIRGAGPGGFIEKRGGIGCGNSGTTARLLMGILSGQRFKSRLEGDESLSRRPMLRVSEPLGLMGADISATEGHLPVDINPCRMLHGIDYRMEVGSAQVKTAIIFAALQAEGTTRIQESSVTRNHTELMLSLKTETSGNGRICTVSKDDYPKRGHYSVAGDISSAAFFILPALVKKGGDLRIRNLLLNPTRTGIIEVLQSMGADIEIIRLENINGERVGDIRVRHSAMKNIEIAPDIIPNIIDEIPILAVAGIFAEGTFRIRGAKELRYKESDRISSIVENLRLAGIEAGEYPDGFEFAGSAPGRPVDYKGFGDHRIAMAFGVLCMLSAGGSLDDFESVGISNPDFLAQFGSVASKSL